MSLYDDLKAILRKERRKCSHVHTNCRATMDAMVKAFELGLDVERSRHPEGKA